MVKHDEEEIPYMFCSECKKLSPIGVVKGRKFCRVCSKMDLQKDGQALVMLNKSEAMLRKLPFLSEE